MPMGSAIPGSTIPSLNTLFRFLMAKDAYLNTPRISTFTTMPTVRQAFFARCLRSFFSIKSAIAQLTAMLRSITSTNFGSPQA